MASDRIIKELVKGLEDRLIRSVLCYGSEAFIHKLCQLAPDIFFFVVLSLENDENGERLIGVMKNLSAQKCQNVEIVVCPVDELVNYWNDPVDALMSCGDSPPPDGLMRLLNSGVLRLKREGWLLSDGDDYITTVF